MYTKAIQLKPNLAEAYINRGFIYIKKAEYDLAIEDSNQAIELNPNFLQTYCNRSAIWLCLGEWEKARLDLATAKEKGANIVNEFREDYESVEAFEEKYNIHLPTDIAEMLTVT